MYNYTVKMYTVTILSMFCIFSSQSLKNRWWRWSAFADRNPLNCIQHYI